MPAVQETEHFKDKGVYSDPTPRDLRESLKVAGGCAFAPFFYMYMALTNLIPLDKIANAADDIAKTIKGVRVARSRAQDAEPDRRYSQKQNARHFPTSDR